MTGSIKNELDPILETLGLLYVGSHFEEAKEEIKKAVADLGFDGEQFYSQHLKSFDKYVQTFKKFKISGSDDDLFFSENDSNYFLVLMSLIIENKNWLNALDKLTDDAVRKEIIHIFNTLSDELEMERNIETLEDLIYFLENSDLSGSAKWKLLRIWQQPQRYIVSLLETINANLAAYQKAVNEISRPLAKLMDRYTLLMSNQSDKIFHSIKDQLSQDADIFPSLVFPLSQLIFESSCHYGLLSHKIVTEGESRSRFKDALLIKLKALSDGSKLEILCSLKISPKYNLEIAQQLGLTAATMSHHMNALLNCGFVGIEKKEGRVYYHLMEDNIRNMIEELKKTLL